MKRIAVVLVMIAILTSLALTGCMPAAGGGIEGGDANSTGGLMGFLPLILIIVVFYFILIRPQNKKNKQVSQMRDSLKRGDWVTTIGGFKGRIVKIKDELITIEVGADKVKLDIMRWGISKIDDSAPDRGTAKKTRDAEPEEKEQPKRKPKKLEPVKKEEPEDEDEEYEDFEDDSDEDDEE